eukprot:scaffold92383_cov33-Cyclotella_meneghiniana.AAC.3
MSAPVPATANVTTSTEERTISPFTNYFDPVIAFGPYVTHVSIKFDTVIGSEFQAAQSVVLGYHWGGTGYD